MLLTVASLKEPEIICLNSVQSLVVFFSVELGVDSRVTQTAFSSFVVVKGAYGLIKRLSYH